MSPLRMSLQSRTSPEPYFALGNVRSMTVLPASHNKTLDMTVTSPAHPSTSESSPFVHSLVLPFIVVSKKMSLRL